MSTIAEMTNEKGRLESAIIVAIWEFEKKYGIHVTGIKGKIDKDLGGPSVGNVELVVKLG